MQRRTFLGEALALDLGMVGQLDRAHRQFHHHPGGR